MTFCHVDPCVPATGSAGFVLNYIRWDEVKPHLEHKYPTTFKKVQGFYKKFYEAENLIGQIGTRHLTMALQKCGFYPEVEG